MLTKKTGLRNLTIETPIQTIASKMVLPLFNFLVTLKAVILNLSDGVDRWQEFVKFAARNLWPVTM
jgi:hypothetical protein